MDALAFLMEQRELTPGDLPEIGNEGEVLDILAAFSLCGSACDIPVIAGASIPTGSWTRRPVSTSAHHSRPRHLPRQALRQTHAVAGRSNAGPYCSRECPPPGSMRIIRSLSPRTAPLACATPSFSCTVKRFSTSRTFVCALSRTGR